MSYFLEDILHLIEIISFTEEWSSWTSDILHFLVPTIVGSIADYSGQHCRLQWAALPTTVSTKKPADVLIRFSQPIIQPYKQSRKTTVSKL